MSNGLPSKWFIQHRGIVQGPYTNESLPQALDALGSENHDHALVWKRGLSEWIKAHQWQKADQKIKTEISQNQAQATPAKNKPSAPTQVKKPTPTPQETVLMTPQTVAATRVDNWDKTHSTDMSSEEKTHVEVDNELFEKTFTQAYSDNAFYRVQVNYVDQPLMSRNELMQLIAKQEDISTISIQDPKTKEWKEIYAFPDLVEKFGISRRETLRVPILAQFSGHTNKSKNVAYRVITISEGGMGLTENFELKIGDEIDGQVSSPHFFQPLHIKAEVVYAGNDGYIGLKFQNLADDTKSAIIEYVKKFGKSAQKS